MLRAPERHCPLPTHSASVCGYTHRDESSDFNPKSALSYCHTQLVFFGLSTTVGCSDCRIKIESFSSHILFPVCVSYFFATSVHFLFPLHRNAVPGISPILLQVTRLNGRVCIRTFHEPVVTNHESADRASSYEPQTFTRHKPVQRQNNK